MQFMKVFEEWFRHVMNSADQEPVRTAPRQEFAQSPV